MFLVKEKAFPHLKDEWEDAVGPVSGEAVGLCSQWGFALDGGGGGREDEEGQKKHGV